MGTKHFVNKHLEATAYALKDDCCSLSIILSDSSPARPPAITAETKNWKKSPLTECQDECNSRISASRFHLARGFRVWFERSTKVCQNKRGAGCPTFTPPPSTVTAASLQASVSLIWRHRRTATNMIAQIMDSFSKLSSDEPAWWGSHHDCFYTITLSIITPINLKNTAAWGTPEQKGVRGERRKERKEEMPFC